MHWLRRRRGARPGGGRHEVLLRPRGGHHRRVGPDKEQEPEKQRAPATSVRKDHLCEHPAEPQGGAAVRLQPGQLLPRHLSSSELGAPPAQSGQDRLTPLVPFRFYSLKAAVIYYFLVVRLTT